MKLISDHVQELKAKQLRFDKENNVEEIQGCITAYTQLLNEVPEDPEIIFQIGTAYLQLGQPGIASQFFKRALDYWPSNPQVWSNLGCSYRAMHLLEKARDCFVKSLMSDEKAETYNNLASCYINENCPNDGMKYADMAMKLEPEHPKPKWNGALLCLELEDWKTGFELYDAGFFCHERKLRIFDPDPPWWDGSPGTLALWDEQGLGDRILAANLLRRLKDVKGLTTILEVHPRLEQIYRRNFPWIDVIYPTSKKDKVDWPKDHKIDYKCSVMSLANIYWREGDFDRTPYIKPNPYLVEKYRKLMEATGPGPYICLSWAGGAPKTNTKYRTLKLGWFEKLIEKGGTWFSIQYHEWAKDKVKNFREEKHLPLIHLDAAHEYSYDHTLAVLAACDLTITACNTVVHTCGAAGLPCWVMVPARRAWRYPSGPTFPWYGDHIIQYHQEKDWQGVIDVIAEDYDKYLNCDMVCARS